MRSLLVVALAAALGGCFVSKVDIDKPELPLPQALPAATAADAQLPDPWWRIFDDATLDRLVDEALTHNPDAAVAAARVAQARALLRMANGERLPALDLEGSATRTKDSVLTPQFQQGFDRYRTSYTVQGVVRYEIDLWGKYARASEAARARLVNSEFGREATKLSLTGEVARNYFGLIAAAGQLARGRDTLATREESLQLEKLRLDAGESDEFTFKRAEADAAATRKSVHQLEFEVVQRTNALGTLLGRSPKDLVESAISLQGASLPGAVALPAGLPSSILARRPDISAAEASLHEAAADIGAARTELFPSISLTGVFGSISAELSDLFTDPAEAWSAIGDVVQPLFQGGRGRANIDRTHAIAEQRKAEYARTVQVAFREVLDSLSGQALIASVRDANAAQVGALTRATELAELRYGQGDIAYLELLDVRRGLFQAEIELVAAQRDVLLNSVDLALALGGGLGERVGP
jgi:outer membrane protein, multidrug efflux system